MKVGLNIEHYIEQPTLPGRAIWQPDLLSLKVVSIPFRTRALDFALMGLVSTRALEFETIYFDPLVRNIKFAKLPDFKLLIDSNIFELITKG